jgi:hypothetical protein
MKILHMLLMKLMMKYVFVIIVGAHRYIIVKNVVRVLPMVDSVIVIGS